MNGRMLLYAIAGIDEAYLRESEQFSEVAAGIKADRKRKRQAMTAVGLAAAVCIAVFGMIRLLPRTARLPEPSDPADWRMPEREDPPAAERVSTTAGHGSEKGAVSTTAEGPTADPVTGTTFSAADTEPHTRSVSANDRDGPETAAPPPAVTKAPEQPSFQPEDSLAEEPLTERPTERPTESPTETPKEPPANSDGPGGTPGAVHTTLNVGYEEAKERFSHPIVPCSADGFTGYQVGVVSRNGDTDDDGAFCLSVSYTFDDGYIGLSDQDRLTGSSASTLGETYEYRGRTFYVQTPDDYGSYGTDYVQVGYYPTWDSGIAYQAVFDTDADIYEIMDLLISVEI